MTLSRFSPIIGAALFLAPTTSFGALANDAPMKVFVSKSFEIVRGEQTLPHTVTMAVSNNPGQIEWQTVFNSEHIREEPYWISLTRGRGWLVGEFQPSRNEYFIVEIRYALEARATAIFPTFQFCGTSSFNKRKFVRTMFKMPLQL